MEHRRCARARSRRARSTARPQGASASSAAVSRSANGSTATSCSRPWRRNSLRSRRSGCPRGISSLRYAPTTQHRLGFDDRGHRNQGVEGRVVGPLEVVEEHGHWPIGGGVAKCRGNRFEQRSPIGPGRYLGPQRARQRPVGRSAVLQRCPLEHGQSRCAQGRAREHGLADAGFARQQQQRAAAVAGFARGRLQPRALGFASDQRAGGRGARHLSS